MTFASKTFVHTTSTMLFIAMFGFVSLFGLTLAMQTNEHGAMADCPFMSERAVACSMGAMEHIAQWQSMFTATVSHSSSTMVFVALVLFLAAVVAAAARAPTILYASSPSPPRHQPQPESRLFNVLVTIFSQGILHPRLYA